MGLHMLVCPSCRGTGAGNTGRIAALTAGGECGDCRGSGEVTVTKWERLTGHTYDGPPAPELPTPAVDARTGVATWTGGTRRVGPLLVIPGRTLDVDDPSQRAEAVQHAHAVLAALRHP